MNFLRSNFKLILSISIFVLLFYSCKKTPDEVIIVSPVPPSLNIFILNKDSISIFVSQTDSINLILAPPNQLLPTFGRLQAWSDLSIGPYLVCGSLITYSAIDKFKTSYLYYSNNPIPDTLFVDYKTINNHKGWRGYDYIPDSVSLNNIKGTQTNQFGNWIFVKK